MVSPLELSGKVQQQARYGGLLERGSFSGFETRRFLLFRDRSSINIRGRFYMPILVAHATTQAGCCTDRQAMK
jgi:hypothetical protein